MSKRVRTIAVLAAVLGGAILLCRVTEVRLMAADTSGCGGADAMKPARNFVLRNIDNQKWTFSSLKGKVVLIDFWATWCGPCKVEIPEFVDMYTRYKDKGLEIVGVSMDTDLASIKSFASEHKMNYPILIGAGADGVTRAWDVVALPTTLLVTREGKLCRKFVGQTAKEQFEDIIRKLL